MNYPEHDGLCELNVISCRMGGPSVRCTCGADEKIADRMRDLERQEFDATRGLIARLRNTLRLLDSGHGLSCPYAGRRPTLKEACVCGPIAFVEEADAWLAAHPKRTP